MICLRHRSSTVFLKVKVFRQGSKLLRQAKPDNSLANSMSVEGIECHAMLKPLSWLIGTWRSNNGKGIYPTISDFAYAEEAEFHPIPNKPIIEYKFHSSKPDGSVALHRETGFIRIKPETNHIAFVAAHNLGVVEIQEGEVTGDELTVETTNLGRTSFNKPPEVKKVRRNLKRTGNELESVMFMETDKSEMTEHLRITLRKVD